MMMATITAMTTVTITMVMMILIEMLLKKMPITMIMMNLLIHRKLYGNVDAKYDDIHRDIGSLGILRRHYSFYKSQPAATLPDCVLNILMVMRMMIIVPMMMM